jgi:hypothetical protein
MPIAQSRRRFLTNVASAGAAGLSGVSTFWLGNEPRSFTASDLALAVEPLRPAGSSRHSHSGPVFFPRQLLRSIYRRGLGSCGAGAARRSGLDHTRSLADRREGRGDRCDCRRLRPETLRRHCLRTHVWSRAPVTNSLVTVFFGVAIHRSDNGRQKKSINFCR